MQMPESFTPLPCRACLEGAGLDFDFGHALQPIVDVTDKSVFAHEALVRGPAGEPAGTVLAQVDETNRYRFDQASRVRAIALASELKLEGRLSINFMPNAIYRAETCLRGTLEAVKDFQLPMERIIFEVTEGEKISDPEHLRSIFREYGRRGFATAIDDFGAGYAGLNLLAEFQPDYIKLDMQLTRSIDTDTVRQSIVRSILAVCRELEIRPIAEGIETRAELETLADMGVRLMQGYFIARPAFRAVAELSEEFRRL